MIPLVKQLNIVKKYLVIGLLRQNCFSNDVDPKGLTFFCDFRSVLLQTLLKCWVRTEMLWNGMKLSIGGNDGDRIESNQTFGI